MPQYGFSKTRQLSTPISKEAPKKGRHLSIILALIILTNHQHFGIKRNATSLHYIILRVPYEHVPSIDLRGLCIVRTPLTLWELVANLHSKPYKYPY